MPADASFRVEKRGLMDSIFLSLPSLWLVTESERHHFAGAVVGELWLSPLHPGFLCLGQESLQGYTFSGGMASPRLSKFRYLALQPPTSHTTWLTASQSR